MRRSLPPQPSSSTAHHLVAATVDARLCATPGGRCRRPPACPHAATLASAPAPKYNNQRAEQPVATENQRLPHLTHPTTIRLPRSKRPSLVSNFRANNLSFVYVEKALVVGARRRSSSARAGDTRRQAVASAGHRDHARRQVRGNHGSAARSTEQRSAVGGRHCRTQGRRACGRRGQRDAFAGAAAIARHTSRSR